MRKIFQIIIYLLAGSCVIPQSLSIINYTSDDGLPTNSVYSIIQDKPGYLWLATEQGAVKYDGNEFTTFSDSGQVPHVDVRVVFEDSKGNIWFGTLGGLSKFDGKNFTIFTRENGLTDEYIQSIDEDSTGNVWVATRGGGIAKINENSVTMMNSEIGLPPEASETIAIFDENYDLWIGTVGYGIYRYSKGKLHNYNRTVDEVVSDTITCINKDREGNLLFGSPYGIAVYKGGKFSGYKIVHEERKAKPIKFIHEDKEKSYWYGTSGNGLFYYDGEQFIHYSEENGLPSDQIYSLLETERGDLWIGVRNGGLFKVAVEKFSIFTKANGLAHDLVYSILKDKDGTLWFGHELDGITRYNEESGRASFVTSEKHLPANGVPSMLQDEKGNIWISAFGGGVVKYDGSKYINYTDNEGLASNFVVSMLEDSEGNIWFGCDVGISMYDPERDEIITRESSKEIFGNTWIYNIYEDDEGFIWVATENKGVMKFNKHKLINTYTIEDGLSSNSVFFTMQDKFGNYWFCTEGGGLSRFDESSFTTYSRKDGLPSNTCYYMAEYSNYFYIGTASGLTRFEYMSFEEKGKDAFKVYNRNDGIPGTEFNSGAMFKDRNMNLYFGSQGGVVKFNPKNKPNPIASKVYMNNVRIVDQEAVIDTLPKAKMELNYLQNNISFNYKAVDFTTSDNLIYKYKLEGSDAGWTETKEHTITYRALPPNDYKFLVICRNSDGIWSETPATVEFLITPPFFLTWWFFTIVIVLVFSVGYMLYTAKTRQVKRRNLELAQMVKKRTRELEEEKDKSDKLLLNILPSVCVNELKEKGTVRPSEIKNASILFTDFKEFTYTASVLPADKLVYELNEIFRGFDEIVEKYGLEKMKTIGDSYMAAGGLPKENMDHAVSTVLAALDMQELIKTRNEKSAIKWEMRAGIHSGAVIAGVVGTKKFVYDIWGDTVNIASRMESAGDPGKVNISAYTYMLIKDHFDCEYRGKLDAKGKGKVDMYFVNGIKKDIESLSINSEVFKL